MKTIQLSQWQTTVAQDNHRYKVINCGRRAGKSFLVSIEMLKHATEYANTDIWYISPTYKQSKSIMWQMLKDIIPQEAINKSNETELVFELINGSRIMLKGADNPDSLRGVKIDLAIFDECAFIDRWEEVWKVIRPTLVDNQAKVWFISTPNGHNHFKDLSENPIKDDNWIYYHYTTYDNPYLSKDEIEDMKKEMSDDAFQQEVMGKFIKKSGLVYKEFDRNVHVKELKDFNAEFYLRGCDKGFRNPTAIPLIAVNKDDVWYQYDEIYQSGLTNPPLAEIIKEKCGVTQFELSTMDCAQAGDIQELNDLGIDFIPVKKESGETNLNYVRWKIQRFAERLRLNQGSSGYYVHPKCVSTIKEFESYSWKEDRDDKNAEEEPIKMNDHMMDALGDLNAMYEHHYKEPIKHPWDNKIPGTFIRASVKEEDDNDWGVIS